VPITKPVQKHVYDIQTVHIHRNETLNRQNKNDMANNNNNK
jgi:hypothetical protein